MWYFSAIWTWLHAIFWRRDRRHHQLSTVWRFLKVQGQYIVISIVYWIEIDVNQSELFLFLICVFSFNGCEVYWHGTPKASLREDPPSNGLKYRFYRLMKYCTSPDLRILLATSMHQMTCYKTCHGVFIVLRIHGRNMKEPFWGNPPMSAPPTRQGYRTILRAELGHSEILGVCEWIQPSEAVNSPYRKNTYTVHKPCEHNIFLKWNQFGGEEGFGLNLNHVHSIVPGSSWARKTSDAGNEHF